MEITPAQIRAARALLQLEASEVARRAGVSPFTLDRLESGLPGTADATVTEVAAVLTQAGVEFVQGGVRERQRSPEEIERRYQAIMAIAERSAAALADHPPMREADLYDENGLPA